MEPNLIWCNMAVSDIERTTHFYTAIGFKPNGSPNQTLTSFIVGTNGLVIHFFTREHLSEGMKGPLATLQDGNEVIFTISAGSKEEVNKWAEKVQSAGGRLISHPEEFGEGYYGFVFADPDGHRFNIFFM